MKGMTLLKALNNIDDKYIQEAEPTGEEKNAAKGSARKSSIVRYVSGFAAVAAVAAVAITVGIHRNGIISSDEEAVTVVNPYVYYDTLEEAEKAVGFEMTSPEIINKEKISEIIVIAGDTIELRYGTDDGSSVTIRKAKGAEDISGDYNTYEFEKALTIDNISVSAKGDDDLIKLLTWKKGEFTFALNSPKGMTEEQVMDIINLIE